ncbi:MAG: diguanylate cyclase [Candidatus Acidiferrales bacterium]
MNGFTVLVADDSPVYRKLVEQTLADEDCVAVFAKSGNQAIEIFEHGQPDLVITDWNMPDLTGIELCRRIRASASTRYTYVIILTGKAEKENVVQGLSAGADDYLAKPFDRDEFLARVGVGRRLIDLHRQIEAKNRLLEELALTDSLTGVPNRRAIEAWSSRQLSGAARHGFSLWMVLIDLDHFKRINDSYGHEAGDAVLKKFAEILRSHTRLSDISGRIGGEEFLFVLTHADRDGTMMVVDRIRQQLAAEKFVFDGATVQVTASFGISGFSGKSAPEFEELLAQADDALYRAKDNGRNRIELGVAVAP